MNGESPKRTDGNESRHDRSEHAEHAVGEGDRDGVAGKHGGGTENGQVGDVGRDVDEGDQGKGNIDRPAGLGRLTLLLHVLECSHLGRLT